MTKDQTKAAAAVMLAWVEGKAVQFKHRGHPDNAWQPLSPDFGVSWNWLTYDHRIKPEPREWWLRQHGKDEPCTSCGLFSSLAEAEQPASDSQKTTGIVHVREVLE